MTIWVELRQRCHIEMEGYRQPNLAVFDDRTGCIVGADPNLFPDFSNVFDIFDCCKSMIAKLEH